MAAYPSLIFVELYESGIGIRNSNISKAHAHRSVQQLVQFLSLAL